MTVQHTALEPKTLQHIALARKLDELRAANPREAAEYAYALALFHRSEGHQNAAEHFGHCAIALLNECPMDTLEQCAGLHVSIENILIPGIFHQDVVRRDLNLAA